MEESPLGLREEVSSADKGDNKTGPFSSPDPSLLSVTSQPTNLLGDDEGPGARRLTMPGTALGALQKPTHSLPHEVGAITILIVVMGTASHGERGGSSALVADAASLPPKPLQGSVPVTAAQLPLSHSLQLLCCLSSLGLFPVLGSDTASSFCLEHSSHTTVSLWDPGSNVPSPQGHVWLGPVVKGASLEALLCLFNVEPCEYITYCLTLLGPP